MFTFMWWGQHTAFCISSEVVIGLCCHLEHASLLDAFALQLGNRPAHDFLALYEKRP